MPLFERNFSFHTHYFLFFLFFRGLSIHFHPLTLQYFSAYPQSVSAAHRNQSGHLSCLTPRPPKPLAPPLTSNSRIYSDRTISDPITAPAAAPATATSQRQLRHHGPTKRKPTGFLKIQQEELSVNRIPSSLCAGKLEQIRAEFHIPDSVEMLPPGPSERAHHTNDHRVAVYEDSFKSGLRFPLPGLLVELLQYYRLGLGQLNPNSIRMLIGFLFLCNLHSVKPSVNLFRRFFTLRINGKESGWYGFAKRPTAANLVIGTPSSNHGWKPRYFFVRSAQTDTLPPWRDLESKIESEKPYEDFSAADEATLERSEYFYQGTAVPSEADLKLAGLSTSSVLASSK